MRIMGVGIGAFQPDTHTIQAPMASERFHPGVVAAMQKKKILGVTTRFVIILQQPHDRIRQAKTKPLG